MFLEILATQGDFALRLKAMLWQAYGPLIKVLAAAVLVVFVVIPFFFWIKKILR